MVHSNEEFYDNVNLGMKEGGSFDQKEKEQPKNISHIFKFEEQMKFNENNLIEFTVKVQINLQSKMIIFINQ